MLVFSLRVKRVTPRATKWTCDEKDEGNVHTSYLIESSVEGD